MLSVLIVILDNSVLAGTSLRMMLENFGYNVSVRYIGSSDDFFDSILQFTNYKYIVIEGHGDAGSLYLPEVGESVPLHFSFYDNKISPEELRQLELEKPASPPTVIISTACSTGITSWAKYFHNLGVGTYIGFKGYPNGNTTILFTSLFFFYLRKNGIEESFFYAKKSILFDNSSLNENEIPMLYSY